jgi:TIR domain
MTIKKRPDDEANEVPLEVRNFFRLLDRILSDITPEKQLLISQIGNELSKVHHKRFQKAAHLYSIAAYIDQLSKFLLGGDEQWQVTYGLAMVEALFYGMGVNAIDKGYLPADYALYASATVLALKNLLDRCRKSRHVPTVFIATAQTPGELVFGNRDRGHKTKPNYVGTRFDDVNKGYLHRFKDLVNGYLEEQQGEGYVAIERHVFARRKFTEWGGEHSRREAEDVADDNERYLNYYLEAVETNPVVYGPRIRALDRHQFQSWINQNHACVLPNYRPESLEEMARIQWFTEPSVEGRDGLKWRMYDVVTDLIVYGSAKPESFRADGRPPKLYNSNIEWEFGLQYIDLGGKSEGRAIKPLDTDDLDQTINFLGFKHYQLRDFIKSLQEGPGRDNPLGLSASGYIVKEAPWKDLWDEGRDSAAGPRAGKFASCFISYSHRDKALAQALHEALKARGVACRLDSYDIKIGEDVRKRIYRHISECDKVIVCLSKHSLGSEWVEYEINAAIDKQGKQGDDSPLLIPLNLDDAIRSWDHDLAPIIKQRSWIDFVGWSENSDIFTQGISKILEALSTNTSNDWSGNG